MANGRQHPWWSVLGSKAENYFTSFVNASAYHLMSWFYSGSTMKSPGELDCLVMDVIQQDDFKKEDLNGFCAAREANYLDEFVEDPHSWFSAEDGWQESMVYISLSAGGTRFTSEAVTPQLPVPGLFHQPLLGVLKAALQETVAELFHLFPFQKYWQSDPEMPVERLYSELYSSDVSPKSIKEYIHNPVSQDAVLRPLLLVLCSGQT